MTPMDSPNPRTVAIIGAGPAGLVLAISLLQRGIKCDIYESRPIQYDSGVKYAALSLQANGLRVLDRIGLYSRLLPCGYSVETMSINDLISGKVVTEGEDFKGCLRVQANAHISFRISFGATDRSRRARCQYLVRLSICPRPFGD